MPSSTGTLVFNDQKIQAPDMYVTESLGVGVSDPTSNLEVVGNAYVSSNLEVGTANLFVDTTTGRVGVGTGSPIQKFHVKDDTSYTVGGRIESKAAPSAGTSSSAYMDVVDGTGHGGYIQGYHDPYVTHGLRLGTVTTGGRDTAGMYLLNSGNVGIGITNPSAKLHVNGNFYAPGSVVQLQTRTFCLPYSTTSSTYTYTGAYVDIIPKFANSKLFVMFDGLIYLGGNGAVGAGLKGYRSINGGTDQQIYAGEEYSGATTSPHNLALYANAAGYMHSRVSLSFGDTPNTSSSVRYKIYARSHDTGTVYLGNGGHQPLTFSVFEIAQ